MSIILALTCGPPTSARTAGRSAKMSKHDYDECEHADLYDDTDDWGNFILVCNDCGEEVES